VKPAAKTLAGGLFSAALSTTIAAVVGTAHGRSVPHVAFLVAAGAIAVVLELVGYSIGHVHPGILFAFFLFEPVGPIVLHQQPAPTGFAATLLLGVGLACVFVFRGADKPAAEPRNTAAAAPAPEGDAVPVDDARQTELASR
jgi:hypothetical protein